MPVEENNVTENSVENSSDVISSDSILDTIKKLIGPGAEHTFFDADLIIHINSALMTLCQIGVGPVIPFRITGSTEKWSDFIPGEINRFRGVIDYVYLRCKLIFDPPTSSFVLSSYNDQMRELEWRLNAMAETPPWIVPEATTESVEE